MKTSIIIPTYQGADKIQNLLNSLLRQTEKDFEVIVVIDGSTDNTIESIKSYELGFKSFKIVLQENKGRSIARNEGVLHAQNELLVFYDDDMILNEDSIKRHRDFHVGMPECLLCGNPVEIYSEANSDVQNYKVQLSEKWISKYPDGISKIDLENLFFTSSNCSMPATVFNQLKFDERLTDVEDFDLAFRALKKEIPVYFDKTNKSIHNEKITARSYVKRLRQYSVAKKKWNEIHSISNGKTKFKLKKFFYLPFASLFWVSAIDRNFFIRIPRNVRYELYDIIIQALAIEFPKVRLK